MCLTLKKENLFQMCLCSGLYNGPKFSLFILFLFVYPGVGDLYTDPQVHSTNLKEYGDANLGTKGMALFFNSHRCNKYV